jgi:hypothetical protein
MAGSWRACAAERVWIGVHYLLGNDELRRYRALQALGASLDLPLVACGDVQMHCAARKALHDVFAALRHAAVSPSSAAGACPTPSSICAAWRSCAPVPAGAAGGDRQRIARRAVSASTSCATSTPKRSCPRGTTRAATCANSPGRAPRALARRRTGPVRERIETELALIAELDYEYYFLTVYDVVRFARERGILCQGRGSAANSVVCYCLFITEVSPEKVSLLFERFISRERDEPPDIDVDFEHERREEVIQYIYANTAAAARRWRRRSSPTARAAPCAMSARPWGSTPCSSTTWPSPWPGGTSSATWKQRFAEQGLTETASGGSAPAPVLPLVQESSAFPATCPSTSAAS